jgi:N-acetylglucosaminyl-diphospho-decaprenol L-rhamnosyltransferase
MKPVGDQPVDVSVVVVSYNAIEWLPRCLAAIEAAAPKRTVEVVVVDNASQNEVRQFLAEEPHGATVIQLETNIGFGRACNLGVKRSRGRLVMLLNPDAVLEPDAIEGLADFLEANPHRGIVGGRTLRPDGGVDPSSCWGAPSLWSWFCSATGLTSVFRYSTTFDPESLGRWQRDTEGDVDIVTGCLLMATRETWERLEGFDEDFFMYGEDADLSLRAADMGFRPGITPAATAVHAVGASSSDRVGKQRLLIRGKATLARKHWPTLRRRAGLSLLAAGVGLRAAAEQVTRKNDRTNRILWSERREWLPGWPPAS